MSYLFNISFENQINSPICSMIISSWSVLLTFPDHFSSFAPGILLPPAPFPVFVPPADVVAELVPALLPALALLATRPFNSATFAIFNFGKLFITYNFVPTANQLCPAMARRGPECSTIWPCFHVPVPTPRVAAPRCRWPRHQSVNLTNIVMSSINTNINTLIYSIKESLFN